MITIKGRCTKCDNILIGELLDGDCCYTAFCKICNEYKLEDEVDWLELITCDTCRFWKHRYIETEPSSHNAKEVELEHRKIWKSFNHEEYCKKGHWEKHRPKAACKDYEEL